MWRSQPPMLNLMGVPLDKLIRSFAAPALPLLAAIALTSGFTSLAVLCSTSQTANPTEIRYREVPVTEIAEETVLFLRAVNQAAVSLPDYKRPKSPWK